MVGYIIKLKRDAQLPSDLKHRLGVVVSKYSGIASYDWRIKLFDQPDEYTFPVYEAELEIVSKHNLSAFI